MRRKHVQDYVEDKTVEGGYRYIGEYYIDKNTSEFKSKMGNKSALLGVLGIGMTLAALSVNCIGVRTIYVVIPLEVLLLCMFLFVLGAIAYRKTSVRMEKRHYEDSIQRMVHMSTIAFVMNLCSIIGQFFIVFKGDYFKEIYHEYLFLVILIILEVIVFDLWSESRKLIAQIVNEGHV